MHVATYICQKSTHTCTQTQTHTLTHMYTHTLVRDT